jgi:tRNA-2-methylthio-N6-dimethylallyladenosine synthase
MKVFIKTYGCQMNERDSEAAAAMLTARGYEIVDSEFDADILLFNTCSVREQAERKAIGKIGILKKLKAQHPEIFIGIMGCMAQNHGEDLLKKLPHVDFIIGTDQLHKLPEIIEQELNCRKQEVRLDDDYSVLTGMSGHYQVEQKISAYIAIMRGCNRFCSYCIVPYVRGREKSREISDIVAEAKELVKSGVKEIMLLGQNVAAFGLDGRVTPPEDGISPFADLLEALNEIDGLKRIRFTSPYPSYFNDKLIDAIARLPKVCNSLHLPLQSGSDRILKLMNRQYTAESYLEIVNKLKAKISEITFSTDVIVAFPGETEADFIATRDLMNEVGFDNAYIFKYSPREGTSAADMPDQIPEEVKKERNQILLEDLASRTKEHNADMVGRTVEVLVEGESKRNSARWSGRTDTNKMVIFTPAETTFAGELVQVKINRSTSMSLFGEIQY